LSELIYFGSLKLLMLYTMPFALSKFESTCEQIWWWE